MVVLQEKKKQNAYLFKKKNPAESHLAFTPSSFFTLSSNAQGWALLAWPTGAVAEAVGSKVHDQRKISLLFLNMYRSPQIHVLKLDVLTWPLHPTDKAHDSGTLNLFSLFSSLFWPAPSFHLIWFSVNTVSSSMKSVNRSWRWLRGSLVRGLWRQRERERLKHWGDRERELIGVRYSEYDWVCTCSWQGERMGETEERKRWKREGACARETGRE